MDTRILDICMCLTLCADFGYVIRRNSVSDLHASSSIDQYCIYVLYTSIWAFCMHSALSNTCVVHMHYVLSLHVIYMHSVLSLYAFQVCIKLYCLSLHVFTSYKYYTPFESVLSMVMSKSVTADIDQKLNSVYRFRTFRTTRPHRSKCLVILHIIRII